MEDKYEYDEELYKVYTGKRFQGKICESKLAGYAKYSSAHSYFSLRLFMFPKCRYFLRKNRDSENYTIFSKFIRDDENVKLLEPVGRGTMFKDLKNYLGVKFGVIPGTNFYLELFPSK